MKIIIYNDGEVARTDVGATDIFVTDESLLRILNEQNLRVSILEFCNKRSAIVESLGTLKDGVYDDYQLPDYDDTLDANGGLGFYEKIRE